MQIDIVNIDGKKVGSSRPRRRRLRRQGQRAPPLGGRQGAAGRQARRHARRPRRRDEVRGGGKKPYKQKGTGNARQGSSRARRNHVGGGKVFGPHPRDYAYTVPKKVKRAALRSALSLRAQGEEARRRRQASRSTRPRPSAWPASSRRSASSRRCSSTRRTTRTSSKSARNLPEVASTSPPEGLNVYDILRHAGLVIAADAIKQVEARVIASPSKAAGVRNERHA